jgi:nucleoside-diphosphate-sugar epimerase
MKVLVTGATGFIGSHLVLRLLKDGHEVRCLSHNPLQSTTLIYGDITNTESLTDAVKDVEVIFHLAAKVQTGYYQDKEELIKVNFQGTRNLTEAALSHSKRLQNFVYLSSAGAIGMFDSVELIKEDVKCTPVTHYGVSKLQAENYLHHYSPYTIIRPPTVYGPRERYNLLLMTRAIKNRKFALIGNGNNLTSVCHISNLIDALMLVGLITGKNQTYHVADSQPISWNRLTEHISLQANAPKPPHLPVWLCNKAAIVLENVSRITKKEPILSRGRVHTMSDNFALDTTKIKSKGYDPKVSTELGIYQTIQWYKEHNLL